MLRWYASALVASGLAAMGIDEEVLAECAVKQLGATLAIVEKRPSRTIKDVHKICTVVTPVMTTCMRGFIGEQTLLGSKPEHLKLLHESQIPSLLLKYLGLTPRAGHPVTPLPAAAEEASVYACKSYKAAVEFVTRVLTTCNRHKNSSYREDCEAILEQLHPASEAGEPGK